MERQDYIDQINELKASNEDFKVYEQCSNVALDGLWLQDAGVCDSDVGRK